MSYLGQLKELPTTILTQMYIQNTEGGGGVKKFHHISKLLTSKLG